MILELTPSTGTLLLTGGVPTLYQYRRYTWWHKTLQKWCVTLDNQNDNVTRPYWC